jgi:ABC-type enterobactin transport system permease subunit
MENRLEDFSGVGVLRFRYCGSGVIVSMRTQVRIVFCCYKKLLDLFAAPIGGPYFPWLLGREETFS